MIWANLLHLGMNMWADRQTDAWPKHIRKHVVASDTLRFNEPLWNQMLKRMAKCGMNMVILDLGEGVKYRSHPELACKGAWSVSKLKKEIKKCQAMGIEVIPKLNFSTAHDVWLGEYARMVSTDIYYGVCKDLIAEVIDIFDKPRFFHLGMDEETAGHQEHYLYAVMRQHDLWWHDLYFFQKQVERANVRAWVWSDYIWHHHDEFLAKMPKSILQSNWYYDNFRRDRLYFDAYKHLDKHGYDQVPTGSNWSIDDNFIKTVRYGKRHLAPERLLGFMQTPWMPTLPFAKSRHLGAIDQVGEAKRVFEN
jgi:hypothetical protein